MRASPSRPAPGGGRRWVLRLLVGAAVLATAVAVRERQLAANTRRFGLPG